MALPNHPNPTAPVISHFDLTGKTAIVTGGTRGIGLEVARGLAEAGAKVAITYASTSPSEADATSAAISESGNGVLVKAYKCNVRNRAEVVSVIEAATKEVGDGYLDIVVANAGIADHIPAIDYPEDRFRDMLDVNFHGAFWTAQAAAKIFKRQLKAGGDGRGSIIFTASVSAILVNVPQKQAAYNASKAAVVHLAKSLSVEWVDYARVNSLSPGFIATDRVEEEMGFHDSRGRLCEPAELKGSYVYLASNASSYMTGNDSSFDGAVDSLLTGMGRGEPGD
ncbi:alcohol dehydrogenase GroES-like domain-containing protein [Colletotrichum tofieldiae]|nr:alcohol dehydrogenase GroES-like domain-containing protein [Colletotrichum tofieldiae]